MEQRLRGLGLVNLPEPLYQEHIRLGIIGPDCWYTYLTIISGTHQIRYTSTRLGILGPDCW